MVAAVMKMVRQKVYKDLFISFKNSSTHILQCKRKIQWKTKVYLCHLFSFFVFENSHLHIHIYAV